MIKTILHVVRTSEISCCQQCPYIGISGGPGAFMVCNHKDAPKQGYILSRPQVDEGFPDECPLIHAKRLYAD